MIALREGNQPLVPSATSVNQNRPLYPYLPNVSSIAETQSGGLMAYNSLQTTAGRRPMAGLEFVGTQDPLEFFSSWKTPDERYMPLAKRKPSN